MSIYRLDGIKNCKLININIQEDVMSFFSEELRIMDRNTAQFMMDEMQETMDDMQETIDGMQETIDEQAKTLEQKERQLEELQQRLAKYENI